MQINGNGLSNNGFSIDDLRKIKYLLDEKNIENEMIILNNYLDDDNRKDSDDAAIIVIKNGSLVEKNTSNNILLNPKSDHTKNLIEKTPKIWSEKEKRKKGVRDIAKKTECFSKRSQIKFLGVC